MRADRRPRASLAALVAIALLSACSAAKPPVIASGGSAPSAPPPPSPPSPPVTPPPPPAFAGCISTGAYQSGFACMPAGKLLRGATTSVGANESTVWVPGMRFPLRNGPAFLNSQVYRYHAEYNPGWLGPTGAPLGPHNDPGGIEQCDSRNYSYPWQDTFCEMRPGGNQSNSACPGGAGHQGVDLRGPVCRVNHPDNEVVAVADGTIVAVEPHYTKLLSEDESVYFNFMHMHFASRPHTKSQLAASPGGIPVSRGTVLGRIGNIQSGTQDGTITVATTRHLHFEIRTPVFNPATGKLEGVPLSPYATLVDSYQRLLAGTP